MSKILANDITEPICFVRIDYRLASVSIPLNTRKHVILTIKFPKPNENIARPQQFCDTFTLHKYSVYRQLSTVQHELAL